MGSQVDGHTYIPMAIAAGSRVIVCEHLPELMNEAVTYVVVSSAVSALRMMAAHFYDHPSKQLKAVAVTGTNGKTIVVHLLYNMVMLIKHPSFIAGMLSTICNKVVDKTHPASHTTPEGLQIQALLHLMVTAGCQYCFMEASSHAIFQKRLAGLHLTGAIFIHITHDHLDYHLDFARYIQAKKNFLKFYLLPLLPL